MPAETTRGRFRTLFVSDVHLGCRYSQAEHLYSLLISTQPERLYLVGDFIDGWRLKRRWHWREIYIRILQRLVQLASQGTQIYYTPGNHDEFLRDYLHDFGFVTVENEFIHETADGRRFVVLHGDRFDDVERHTRWLSVLGAWIYDGLVCANGIVNDIRRRLNLQDCRFSAEVKVWTKSAVRFISDFEERLVCHAKDLECDGVVCGHIHVPRIERFGEVLYCNTGDWVEHCTALVEHESGKLELLNWSGGRMNVNERLDNRQPQVRSRPFEPVAENLAAAFTGKWLRFTTATDKELVKE